MARNGLVGIRTRATQASDVAWRDAHAAAVRPASALFLAMLPGSVTAWLLPGHQQVQVACSIVIAVLIVVDAVAVLLVSSRAASSAT